MISEQKIKNYVPLQKATKYYKLYTSDIRKIFKIKNRILPPLPPYTHNLKALPSTDVD